MGEFSYCYCCSSAQDTHENGYNAQGVNLTIYVYMYIHIFKYIRSTQWHAPSHIGPPQRVTTRQGDVCVSCHVYKGVSLHVYIYI